MYENLVAQASGAHAEFRTGPPAHVSRGGRAVAALRALARSVEIRARRRAGVLSERDSVSTQSVNAALIRRHGQHRRIAAGLQRRQEDSAFGRKLFQVSAQADDFSAAAREHVTAKALRVRHATGPRRKRRRSFLPGVHRCSVLCGSRRRTVLRGGTRTQKEKNRSKACDKLHENRSLTISRR